MNAAAASLSPAREQAIEWLVELRSGEAGPAQHQAFAAWMAADPAHGEAWRHLTGAVDHAFSAPPLARAASARAVDATLARADTLLARRRRALRGALGIAGLGLATAWLGRAQGLFPDWVADVHTATAERHHHALPDGSSLLLDARSSADVSATAEGGTRVNLRAGQLIAQRPAAGAQPLKLGGAGVQVSLQQGRCLIGLKAGRLLVCPLTGPVAVAQASGPASDLQPGQSAWFGPGGAQAINPLDTPLLAAWEHGMLAVRDQPLDEVVARLQAYRHGLLRVAGNAAALRVSGTYPLDDTDAALLALAETLPIAVRRYTGGWLVRIEALA